MSAEAEAIVTTAAADATTSPTTIKKVAAVDADTTPDNAVPVATDGASEGNGKVEQERAEKILKGKELFSQGSRNFLVKSYDEAADELSQVCQLYEEVYGELADELGQPLLLYAKALIAMALDENKVIDVPDEAADDDDEDMDDDEEAGDEADEAAESKKEAGEAKKEAGEAKEAGESKEEAAPSKKEANGASSTNGKALDNIKEATDEADSTVDASTDEKNAKKSSTGVEEVSSSNGGASVNDDERPSTSNGEAAASPSNGAAAVAGVEDEEETEEGVSGSLQLAWEILEAAAKIFLRQGLNGLPYLAEVQTELANIEFENGILEAAREDYEKALLILSDLPTKNRRALAELHYKIGLTFLMAQQNKEGAASLRLSSALIEEEITEIKGKEEPLSEREKNNMLDLEETKQEILAKIQEIEEMQAQTIAEVRAALDSYIKPMGSGSSSSGGGGGGNNRPGHRKSSLALALTPEDEPMDVYQRNLMDLKYPTVLPPNPQLKALLVFHKSDSICEAVASACQRHQLDVTLVKSKEEALDTLHKSYATAQCYHLIIIDARSSKNLDAEHIARTIRHTHGHHLTTIIAVCKKSFFEKDDVLIALLDAGVNRCVAETTNLAMCSVELKQILHSIIRPHNVMSTQQALYTALHRLKEVVLITDDVLRIQYANRATERLLNMRLDEIISKPLADIFVSDLSTISEQGKSIKEFDGILTVRRKNQEGIPMHVRVVPVACIGSAPTHLIFNFDVPGGQMDFIATLPQPKEAPRGSLHSVRRCSFDVRSIASDGLRRTSLAKLTSLPLEAPITKIINLLSQVQENCSADEARLIDKVLEFLKREGLYSPQMKEIRTDDPIATDLIGALLTGPSVYSSRRSSNDSIIRTGSSTRTATIVPAKMKANPIIMELLEESLSWDFDIFKLEEITDYHPLLYLGMEMFRRFDVFATLNIDENVCKAWLAVIEAHYHKSNTYHNSTHAADVMQATGAFITQLTNKDMMVMDRMEEAMALIAAAAHDIDHPGRSSAFLCNSNSSLAILYNDLTVLENHHAAITFKLTLGDDKINIFKNLDKETYKSARSTIIDMILATEMTRHFEHLAKFVSVFGGEEPREHNPQSDEETSILMRRMLIKVADVSNPARPMQFCIEWARRIAEEYFMQTDEEKQRHLPIVMPMFDRATCSIPKSQIGFIEYIIQDMMHAWESFIDMPQLITYMQINYSQWKKYDEQGVNTLADIMAKQPPMGKLGNSK